MGAASAPPDRVEEVPVIDRLLANCTVSDIEQAEDWYTRLLGSAPSARPMAGLLEWHIADDFGLQVWAEPERAGGSTVVFGVTDLDATSGFAREAGIDHTGPEPGGAARILRISDPDGNRVVFTGE